MDRKIQYYKNYFIDFYQSLDSATQRKIAYIIQYIKTEPRWNERFVKFIRDGIFELRASHNGNIYRVFFIQDEGNIVILFNGFQKKTQKTPRQEIEKAVKIKEQYYAEKQQPT
jgi:putative addiction module killer protein